MLDLNGVLSVEIIHELIKYTDLRLKNKNKYICAEALGMFEQRIISNEEILAICEKAMKMDLYCPPPSFIPERIVRHFHNSNIVPISFSPMRNMVTCVALKEIGTDYIPIDGYNIDIVYTTIYYYFSEYIKHYGYHDDLLEVPAKQLIDSIVHEAISLGAADITISSVSRSVEVYYNVRKKTIFSQRILTADNMKDIIKYFCFESPMDDSSAAPKYVGVSLNDDWRGRVTINRKYKGYVITVRLLPNAAFEGTLEKCNISKEVITFLRRDFMNNELGLRLIVGAPMSGKNTTALAILREMTLRERCKVVSIEMPVEQELEGVEQINCDNEIEYELNVQSLIRQNPDFVYITEIMDTTAMSTMKTTNTGKKVLSTIHANSVSDVVGRIQDITGLSTDRIIQTIHSIVYQELVRDDSTDTVRPKLKCVYLSQERKKDLYNKSYGDVLLKIREWEIGDIW